MKFEIVHLIDVISENPDDYTIKEIFEADNEIEALKKAAIGMTKKSCTHTIQFIKDMQGTLEEIMRELMFYRYCFISVLQIKT